MNRRTTICDSGGHSLGEPFEFEGLFASQRISMRDPLTPTMLGQHLECLDAQRIPKVRVSLKLRFLPTPVASLR